MNNPMRKQWRRPAVWLAGVATVAWALSGCDGWGPPKDSGTALVDLRPVAAQMNDQPASGGYSAQSVSSPGNTATTTDVKSIIIGALVIAFTDTPIGPDTSLTKAMQDDLTAAAKNSIKFIKIVQLPSPDPFVEFDLPPPEASHWQVFAVGTRDKIDVLGDLGDNSPIYFGFNVDANNKPAFFSGSDAPATITLNLFRACIANTPPAGCAQYKTDRTAAVTGDLEILSISVNGTPQVTPPGGLGGYPILVRAGGSSGTPCNLAPGCTPSVVATGLVAGGVVGTAATARVETTHATSAGQPIACTNALTALNAGTMRTACGSQFYTTNF